MAGSNKITLNDIANTQHNENKDYQLAQARLKKAYDDEYALCARDFWYWARFVKTVDEDAGEVRPFPCDFEYLHRLKNEADNHQKVIILKSRRLMASWFMVLDQLHDAMFTGTGLPETFDAFRGGLMSIGKAEAEYLMQRMKNAYNSLPDWMKDRNPLVSDNVMFMKWKAGGIVQAFPLKREGPQTFGFTKVGFDEMALQDAVRTVWTGLIPTLGAKGKLLAVSTPNGRMNLFSDIWHNKDEKYSGIHRVKLHWWEHPEHDQAWYDATTDGMDSQMVARMFELSFAAYYGSQVWNKWDSRMHIAREPIIAIDSSPMYIGWDHGFHFPAATFWQRNNRDQWMGLRELQGFDIPFDEFCYNVLEMANTFYDRKKIPEIHCVPPDARNTYRNRAKSGAANDVAEIKRIFAMRGNKPQIRFGAKDVGTRDNESARLKETRTTFNMRSDGEPGLYVDEKMERFIEGCQGGYCYPENGGEKPLDNEYAHVQCSLQAVVTAYNSIRNPNKFKDKAQERRDAVRQLRKDPFRSGLPFRNKM